MANVVYNYFKKAVLAGSFNLNALPTIYVALVNNSYSPDVDADLYATTPFKYQIVGTNYVAGGAALSSPNVQQDNTGNQGILYGTNVTWVTSSITARGAILYGSSGSGMASDPLIAYIDFGSDQQSVAGNFTIQWAAGGILALT